MSCRTMRTAGFVMLILALLTACQPTPPPPTPTVVPPTAVPTIAPSPTPDHPAVKPDAIRLDFTGRTMMAGPGDIQPGQSLQHVLTAAAGQKIIIKMTVESGSGAALSIWGADGNVLVPETVGITAWEGILPTAQDYYLNFRNTGQQPILYQSEIRLPPLIMPAGVQIQFQPNTTGWYTPGDLPARGHLLFVLNAMAGQQMYVDLTTSIPDAAFLKIWSADGMDYTMVSPTQHVSIKLPSTQDYYIDVWSVVDQPITYQLSVNIPVDGGIPLAIAPTAVPAAAPVSDPNTPQTIFGARIARNQIIRYDAGPLSLEINGAVISGERDVYRLNCLAGETLDVIITSTEANAVFTILGPDNNPLPGTEEGKDINNWAVPISVEGTYSIVVGPTRGNATYTLKVSI